MGGQACVLYGAAEFSRDTDLALLATPENLERFSQAMDHLGATVIAVPPFERRYLERGHAIHFAYGDRATGRMRIDVMSRMRNVDPFAELWERRTSLVLDDPGEIDVLSVPDLVISKKTQRDKDWPMVRRLVDVNYLTFRGEPTRERIAFWLRELRSPPLLVEATARFPGHARDAAAGRPALAAAVARNEAAIASALAAEESREREADRQYWAPLVRELEAMRRGGGSADQE
jgi:hypothetical protein